MSGKEFEGKPLNLAFLPSQVTIRLWGSASAVEAEDDFVIFRSFQIFIDENEEKNITYMTSSVSLDHFRNGADETSNSRVSWTERS